MKEYDNLKFSATYPNAQEFKNLIKAIQNTVDEAVFVATPKRLDMRAMCPSRVSMIDVGFFDYGFEEYYCPETTKFMIDLEQLLGRPLKNVTKSEQVIVEVPKTKDEKDYDDKLKLKLKDGALTREFTQSLLELDEEEVPPPKVKYDGRFNIKVKTLEKILKDADDHIRIKLYKDKLNFKSGDDKDYEVTLREFDGLYGNSTVNTTEHPITGTKDEYITANYSVTYLRDFVKVLKPLVEWVFIEFSTDMPLHVWARVGKDDVLIHWYLAPRIECD